MGIASRLAEWLDIRSHEVRVVTLSLLGAFLVLAFMVLGRSLREAFYLTDFEVETLPYVIGAVAVASMPLVALFTRMLGSHSPRRVVNGVALIQAGGLLALWPLIGKHPAATVAFYLWTALGALLLTSGFWVVVSDCFPLRGAKRLYGLISAGGTAGAMVMGLSLSWLTGTLDMIWFVPMLAAVVVMFCCCLTLMPAAASGSRKDSVAVTGTAAMVDAEEVAAAKTDEHSMRSNLGLIWRTPHVRTIASIVFIATVATTLIDYQFKEIARAAYPSQADLAGFFGSFYGWTGGIALLVQMLVTGRIMASAGVATGLAIAPVLVLLGSAGMLAAPGLLAVLLVRGVDYSLRKSLFRPLIELLYVPLPAALRRRTKTFVDSVLDSVAEGLGALVILCWVTLPGLPSRWLSGFVIVLSLLFLIMSRHMGREYFNTIRTRLKEESDAGNMDDSALSPARDLLSGTFTRLNIRTILFESGIDELELAETSSSAPDGTEGTETSEGPVDILESLRSPDDRTVQQTLATYRDWKPEHMPALTRLLARDALYNRVVAKLQDLGEVVVPSIVRTLKDEDADFVIRRRIPTVLAASDTIEADDALLDALTANRFEVRYRAALALVRRRKLGKPESPREWRSRVWHAIRIEVKRDRPLWELQKLLDEQDTPDDDLVVQRVGVRGELSLEHTFRMLSLVLEPQPVRAAFQGIILDDDNLKGFALEYLEHVLPASIKRRLWLFIGDLSEYRKQKELRSIDQVVSDLMSTRATMFAGDQTRDALKRMLEESQD